MTTPVLLIIAVIDPSGGARPQQVLFSTILDRKGIDSGRFESVYNHKCYGMSVFTAPIA